MENSTLPTQEPTTPPAAVSAVPMTPAAQPLPPLDGPEETDRPSLLVRYKGWISTGLILIAAPLIALLLTAFVFQSYEVDGPSMSTTLENHDRLIVLKVPRTWARITRHAYIPKRNDVVIFVKRGLFDEAEGKDKQLIKRVVGLPGDHVVVSNGTLTIYNKEHPEGFQPDKTYPYGNVITTTPGNVDLVVPPGEIFVCGDNRINSLDSRIFGTVPARDVIGKLVLRMLPFSQIKKF